MSWSAEMSFGKTPPRGGISLDVYIYHILEQNDSIYNDFFESSNYFGHFFSRYLHINYTITLFN